MVMPPAVAMRCPIAVEPVKLTISISGLVVSSAEGSEEVPVMMLMTPGGKPTSCIISTNSITASGSCGAGLITTVHPTASAGAILPATLTTGKLYGEMHATTPTGWR